MLDVHLDFRCCCCCKINNNVRTEGYDFAFNWLHLSLFSLLLKKLKEDILYDGNQLKNYVPLDLQVKWLPKNIKGFYIHFTFTMESNDLNVI